MSQMNCTEVEGLLEAYLMDELEGPELQGVIAHLGACPVCRQRATVSDPVKMFVPLASRELEGNQRWEGFWQEIAGKIEQPPRRRSGRVIPFPGTMRWVAAVGAVAATALLGIFLVQQGTVPGQPEPILQAEAPLSAEEGADNLVESIYIEQIAESLPAHLIERRGEVRALRLTRVDERSSDSVNHYRAGGEVVPATVSDVQLAEQMESIIEYSLVISEDAVGGETEEVRVVSFESEQFPFGCQAFGEAEENSEEHR